MAAFHGKHLPDIPSYPVLAFPEVMGSEASTREEDSFLSEVFVKNKDELSLIKGLKEKIENTFSDQFDLEEESFLTPDVRRDLIFLPKPEKGTSQTESRSTPLCLVQVGVSSKEWWKKFYHGITLLNVMRRTQRAGQYCFEEPVILIVITLDDDSNCDFDFQMGVFLCTPRKDDRDFRVSLIWHNKIVAKDAAATSFGFLLRSLPHFQAHRNKHYEGDSEYFSSNCINVGDKVSDAGGAAPGSIIYVDVLGFDNYWHVCCCLPFDACADDFCYCGCNLYPRFCEFTILALVH